MLLGSPVQDRFASISVSVTLLSILIKYVSHPQAFTAAKMETSNSNSSNRKSKKSLVSFFPNGKFQSRGKMWNQNNNVILKMGPKTKALKQKCNLGSYNIKAFKITMNKCYPNASFTKDSRFSMLQNAPERHTVHTIHEENNPPTISALTSLLTKRVLSRPLPIPQTLLHTALICCKCTKCILQLMFP